MTDSLMKQLVFDCAMELLYGQEELSNEEIGAKLLTIISSHDMNELDVDEITEPKEKRQYRGKRAMVSDRAVDDISEAFEKRTDEAIRLIGKSTGF